MPGFNGTGPRGGGRGAGGAGGRGGLSQGGGRGAGRLSPRGGYSGWPRSERAMGYGPDALGARARQDEAQVLQAETDYLKRELAAMQKRLAEIEGP